MERYLKYSSVSSYRSLKLFFRNSTVMTCQYNFTLRKDKLPQKLLSIDDVNGLEIRSFILNTFPFDISICFPQRYVFRWFELEVKRTE